MSDWRIHRLDHSLADHAQAWDGLHARLFSANPMLDSRFVDAALKHFGEGNERLCILEEGDLPQAMCVLRPASIGRWATFLPSQMEIGPVLLRNPQHVAALMRRLPGFVQRIDFLCNDPDFGDLSHNDNRMRESHDHALTMRIRLAEDFATYWAARPKKLVQNIGRYQRRLADKGIGATMVRVDAPGELGAAVARYAKLESRGWKGAEGTALDVDNVQGRFYLDVMARFSQTRGAAAYELWFDNSLAASRLMVAGTDCVVMLKTTYDESVAQYSPGRLLLYRVIEDLFARQPGGVIEFYTDANVDLLSWSTDQRWISHVTFDRSTSTSQLFNLISAGRHALRAENNERHRVVVYHHPAEFPAAVKQLFQTAESSSIELGVGWYSNLLDTVYPANSGACFYTLWSAGQPIAALPVLVTRKRWGLQVQSLANFYSALYAPALATSVKPEDLAPLLRAILDDHAPLESIRLAPMDPESRTYRLLITAMRTAGLAPCQFFCFGNWYMKVDGPWAGYMAAREGVLSSTIKRKGKKFAANGGHLEIIQGGTELERAIQAYGVVYAASWKVPEPFVKFTPGLIRMCAERGWLRLGIARIGEQAVAAQIWIVANGKAYIYKLAYDEKYKADAIGTVLTAALMQHVFERDKVKEVDYLIGDDAYKKAWVNERRERWGIVAYNPRSLSGILSLIRELGGLVARRLQEKIRTRR